MSPEAARRRAFDCSDWCSRPPNVDPARRDGVHDRYSAVVSDGSGHSDAFAIAADQLLRYRIFSPGRLHHFACGAGPTLAEGDTIVQRIFVAAFAIEAAVRVIEVLRERDRIGFSYVTLEGHVERGVASFFVARSAEGEVTFEIESWSTPSPLTRWLLPGVARYFQRKSVQEALQSFAAQVASGGAQA